MLQFAMACTLMIGYACLTHTKANLNPDGYWLWNQVFFRYFRDHHRPLTIAYTVLNCLICLASMITSIILTQSLVHDGDVPILLFGYEIEIRNTKVERKNITLSWLIVDAIYVFHLLLVCILSFVSSVWLLNGRDLAALGGLLNLAVLAPFAISMLVSFGFFLEVRGLYRKLQWTSQARDLEPGNEMSME